MDHLTLKNPVGIQSHPLIKGKERDTIGISLEMNLRKLRSRDEFKKAKPPTFDGKVKTGQEDEAWLLGITKYFQVHDYSGNMKARVSIFNMNGRASIWWEHFK